MTEILTESFCERCGTRYTFETARPRNSRFGRAKTFTKGLRNYVLSDDSFSEAMADARGEDELAATVLQLDAFHKTFNFCLSCRQYTCGSCWNAAEGRCLSCAPLPDSEPIEDLEPAARQAIADRLATIAAAPEGPPEDETIRIAAWPAADLPAAAPEAAPVEPAAPEAAPVEAEPVPPAAIAPVPPSDAAGGAAVAAADELALETVAGLARPAGTEPAQTEPPTLQGLRPGESLDDAIAAYEATHPIEVRPAPLEPEAVAALAPEAPAPVTAEPIAAAPPETPADAVEATLTMTPAEVPVAEPAPATGRPEAPAEVVGPAVAEPEPQAATAEPTAVEPEPARQPEPPSAPPPPPLPSQTPAAATPAPTLPEPIAAAAAPVEPAAPPAPAEPAEPAAPAAAAPAASPSPAQPAPLAPGWLTVAPDDGSAPAWPQRPAWPATARPAAEPTLAGRSLLPSGDAAALWAASAREVMQAGPVGASSSTRGAATTPTPQPCVGCGLSLSANARFCRRCGARQP